MPTSPAYADDGHIVAHVEPLWIMEVADRAKAPLGGSQNALVFPVAIGFRNANSGFGVSGAYDYRESAK